jgi:Fur family zinc uptake transcriptional regulator
MHDCPACHRSADAAAALHRRGERLTALRARVLETLHHSDRPLGAYDIFDRLKADGAASAPPAVYRVLDFLEGQGLVHKLRSLGAYRACTGGEAPHRAVFRICRHCGAVSEKASAALDRLADEAGAEGFAAEEVVAEILGTCGPCRTGVPPA